MRKIIKYGSVCSGIEAATVAWHDLGWKPAFFSDIEPFPRAVLNHHYSDIPCHGDFTTIKGDDYGSIDLLVGGTPCQSFSVAGLRKGFNDDRGNLTLEFVRLVERKKPRWVVWENVPGVLSQDGGRAFGSFLGGLAELGYGFAYRVLDAQYFGVPQRRRRVFVVGYLGDWRVAAAVLFERASLLGDITPSREKGQRIAATITRRSLDGGGGGTHCGSGEHFQVESVGFTSSSFGGYAEGCGTLRSAGGDLGGGSETLLTYDRQSSGGNAVEPMYDVSPCLTKADRHGVAHPVYEVHGQDSRVTELGDTCSTLTKKYGTGGGNVPITIQKQDDQPMIVHGTQDPCVSDIAFAQGRNNGGENVYVNNMKVRRLTPIECERLQGFPDEYTNIPWRGKGQSPDGPRYQALGNSMAVPVMKWIGQRIQIIEDEICKK